MKHRKVYSGMSVGTYLIHTCSPSIDLALQANAWATVLPCLQIWLKQHHWSLFWVHFTILNSLAILCHANLCVVQSLCNNLRISFKDCLGNAILNCQTLKDIVFLDIEKLNWACVNAVFRCYWLEASPRALL